MSLRAQTKIAILLMGLVLAAMPTRGQVVSVMDEHGNRVYINTNPPPPKAASTPTKGPVMPQDTSNAVHRNQSGFVVRTVPPTANSNGQQTISREKLEALIQTIATRHNVDPALVRAVMKVESGGNPSAVSRKGAMGLMQLMPETAMNMGVTKVFDPQENLDAGVRTLRSLLVRYGGDLDKALAAYNAGTGAVDRAGGVPRYRETRDYVKKVTNNYFQSESGQPVIASGTGRRVTAAGNAMSSGNASLSSNSTSSGNTTAPAASHRIYQVRDAQGRLVWVNE
jgi:membrane-bound lytic murein transglycosylase B